MNLIKFMQSWNTNMQKLTTAEETMNWFVNAVEAAYIESYTLTGEVEREKALRISSLGKPALVQALQKLGMSDYSSCGTMRPRNQFPLYLGHVIEATVIAMMHSAGVDVHGLQKEVEFHGVKGHIDALYADNAVIDVKSMSRAYFDKFTKQPTDDRGYITQLLCYAEACQVANAYVVCIDKQFGEMDIIEMCDDTLPAVCEAYVRRARMIVNKMSDVYDLPTAFSAFPIPELQPPTSAKQRNLLIPDNLKFGPWKNIFYEMTEPANPYSYTARKARTIEEAQAICAALLSNS